MEKLKNKKIIHALFLFIAVCTSKNLFAYAPTNFFRPFDVDFKQFEWKRNNFRLGALVEYGEDDHCRNWDSDKTGLFQMYNQTESSLAALLGHPRGCYLESLAKKMGISSATITDDDLRGHFKLNGKYKEWNSVIFARYKLPVYNLSGIFDLSVFVPIKTMEFYDVSWCELTKNETMADRETKEYVTDDLDNFVKTYGCNLNLNRTGWKGSGLGDVAVMLGWQRDFKQLEKEYLNSVRINMSVGLSIPTGKQKDENQCLSLPLGNDGAWVIPARAGLDLNFVHNLTAGIDISFMGPFDRTGQYRMKTERNQTDYLLLSKANATKSQGATWQFTLFGQSKRIFGTGLSAMASYYFVRHDEDKLSPESYNFDYSIVNSAQSLKEWVSHTFLFQIGYNLYRFESKTKLKPQISLFYKLPIAGRRTINSETFGGQLSFTF